MNRSLREPTSGCRVFIVCLLSFLLITPSFVRVSATTRQIPQPSTSSREASIQFSSLAATTTFTNAPIPKPAPEPPAPLAPAIVATLDDGLPAATTVAPGGTINYTATITNTASNNPVDNATNVQFSDTIDAHTTLVSNSRVAARSDNYSTIGNTQISVPDGVTDLLGNDFDPDTGNNGGMTTTAETKSSSQCAGCNNITIAGDGSFTYDPPVGFTGTDTFTYTATSGGVSVSTYVKVVVGGMIWYVKNSGASGGACSSNCDGRL